jgi:hypothetical protein
MISVSLLWIILGSAMLYRLAVRSRAIILESLRSTVGAIENDGCTRFLFTLCHETDPTAFRPVVFPLTVFASQHGGS